MAIDPLCLSLDTHLYLICGCSSGITEMLVGSRGNHELLLAGDMHSLGTKEISKRPFCCERRLLIPNTRTYMAVGIKGFTEDICGPVYQACGGVPIPTYVWNVFRYTWMWC